MLSHSFNAQSAELDRDFWETVNVVSGNRSWVVEMKTAKSIFQAIREWFPNRETSFSVYCIPQSVRRPRNVRDTLPEAVLLNIMSYLDSPRPSVCIYEEFDEDEYGCGSYHSESVPAPANVKNPLCLYQVFTPENGEGASSTHFLCEPREVCGFGYTRATDDTIATLKAYGERLTEHHEPLTLVIQFHEYRRGVDEIDVDECFSMVQRLQPWDTKEEDERWAESYEWVY